MITPVVAEAVEVRVSRGAHPVLQGPSLRLDAGRVTLLLGPNGAGKTTLLRAMAGVIPLDGGQVRVGGLDPRRDRRARAQLALVPQELALYPRLTVRENVETFAALAGQPRCGTAVEDALRRAALDGDGSRLVATLSGGLQRRVNIACALVGSPRLLLLDEPTVGLDVLARRAVLAALRDIATTAGIAVLMTTHDLDDAALVADDVAVLRDGRFVAVDHPDSLVTRAFPEAWQRVEVLLATPADAQLGERLAAGQLRPQAEQTHWRGYAGPSAVASLLESLKPHAVREVRLRRPSLEDAYARLIDEPAFP